MGVSVWPYSAKNAFFGKCSDWLQTHLKRCASTRAFEWCNRRVISWPTSKVMAKTVSISRNIFACFWAFWLRFDLKQIKSFAFSLCRVRFDLKDVLNQNAFKTLNARFGLPRDAPQGSCMAQIWPTHRQHTGEKTQIDYIYSTYSSNIPTSAAHYWYRFIICKLSTLHCSLNKKTPRRDLPNRPRTLMLWAESLCAMHECVKTDMYCHVVSGRYIHVERMLRQIIRCIW